MAILYGHSTEALGFRYFSPRLCHLPLSTRFKGGADINIYLYMYFFSSAISYLVVSRPSKAR